ncbi:MAG: hypothetical protein JSV95_09565 [Gemmatimonadota bacterium]|nr:MAG: hypothetical protein JSV95_09565 [Gemmatimonadota bacterium]
MSRVVFERPAQRPGLLLLALVLAAGWAARPASGGGDPASAAPASEQTLRTDLLRLHRDQALHLARYGAYAFTLRELDFRSSDGVSITLRWISARSYYAIARGAGGECMIGQWDVSSNLPVSVQTRLTAPGAVSCEAGG